MSQPCLFCKIVAKEIPADVVFENADVVAFRDIHPAAPTHILVIPREHLSGLQDAKAEHAALLGRTLASAAQVAQEQGLVRDGFRTVINTGPNAGQTVFHLHVHLLAGRALAWPPG